MSHLVMHPISRTDTLDFDIGSILGTVGKFDPIGGKILGMFGIGGKKKDNSQQQMMQQIAAQQAAKQAAYAPIKEAQLAGNQAAAAARNDTRAAIAQQYGLTPPPEILNASPGDFQLWLLANGVNPNAVAAAPITQTVVQAAKNPYVIAGAIGVGLIVIILLTNKKRGA